MVSAQCDHRRKGFAAHCCGELHRAASARKQQRGPRECSLRSTTPVSPSTSTPTSGLSMKLCVPAIPSSFNSLIALIYVPSYFILLSDALANRPSSPQNAFATKSLASQPIWWNVSNAGPSVAFPSNFRRKSVNVKTTTCPKCRRSIRVRW